MNEVNRNLETRYTKYLKDKKGITMVALIVTIIILLILSGIVITQLTGDNGLFIRAKQAKNNTIEAQTLEQGILKDYEQKIDNIRTASRDGLEISNSIEDFSITAKQIYGGHIEIKIDTAEKIKLTDENSSVKGYILYSGEDVLDVFNSLPYYFSDVKQQTTYKDLYLKAIDNKGKVKDSSNKITIDIPNAGYIYNKGKEYEVLQGEYYSSSGTRVKNADNIYMDFSDYKDNWHFSCYFGMQNQLDVTNIKKIIVHYSELKLTGNTTAAIILSTSKGTYSPAGTIYYKQDDILDENNSLNFDVSDLSGSYYLSFGIGSHDKNCPPVDSATANQYTGTGIAIIDSVMIEYK